MRTNVQIRRTREKDRLSNNQTCQTFLAVNDKVAVLVSCGDLICDPVPIRVLRQHRGNKCVGARVLWDERPISDKTHTNTQSTPNLHFSEGGQVSWNTAVKVKMRHIQKCSKSVPSNSCSTSSFMCQYIEQRCSYGNMLQCPHKSNDWRDSMDKCVTSKSIYRPTKCTSTFPSLYIIIPVV